MANIKTLKDLAPGTVFDAGPIDVRVLDHMTNGTTLLIADKAVAWRPFSLEPLKTRPEEAPTPYPNDFSLSYLKDELNGPFLAAFDTAGGPIRSANIVEANWSLADHRGGFGYGNMKAKISLLPEALFLPSGPGRLVVACDPVRRQRVQRALCQRGRQSAQRHRVQRLLRRPAGFLRGIWNHSGIRRRRSGGRRSPGPGPP